MHPGRYSSKEGTPRRPPRWRFDGRMGWKAGIDLPAESAGVGRRSCDRQGTIFHRVGNASEEGWKKPRRAVVRDEDAVRSELRARSDVRPQGRDHGGNAVNTSDPMSWIQSSFVLERAPRGREDAPRLWSRACWVGATKEPIRSRVTRRYARRSKRCWTRPKGLRKA